MFRAHTVVLTTVLTCMLAPGALAQGCSEVLSVARDTLQLDSSKSTRVAMKEALCDERLQKFANQQGGNFEIGLPIEGIPIKIGGGATSAASSEAVSKFCKSASSTFSEDQAVSLLKQVASKVAPEAIAAWSICMSGTGSRVLLSAKEDEDSIIIAARAVANDDGRRPLIDAVKWVGAIECEGLLRVGRELTLAGVRELCTRKDDEPVALIVQTSLGSAELKFPRRIRAGTKAGVCNVVRSTEKVDYVFKGRCEKGPTTFSGNHDNQPGAYYSVAMQAPPDTRLGAECSRVCVPNQAKNGCPFAYWSNEMRDGATGVSFSVNVTGPQVALAVGYQLFEKTVTYPEMPAENVEMLYDRTFSVEVPAGGVARLDCSIGQNKFITALPVKDDNNVVTRHFGRIAEQKTPTSFIYTYRVLVPTAAAP